MSVYRMDGPCEVEPATVASKLRCDLITDFSKLEQLSADWGRLWRADSEGEIFQSFEWARAWWRSYGDRISLRSLVVLEGERVLGILPLVKDGERIVFLGSEQADYSGMLCESDRAAEVFATALDSLLTLPDWKECVLSNLTRDGTILRQSATLPRKLRRHLQTVYVDDCYTIPLSANRDVVLDTLLSKHHTKRLLNKLRKAGAITFRHIESKAEAHAQLSEFLRHQMQGRALVGKSGIPARFCSFLHNLIDELDLTRELRFGVLELNDHPLAWHVSFHVNNKLLFYQQTFDVDNWNYSPGEVLVHELLRYVQENAVRELDFAHGDEFFKNRFTTYRRRCYSLYIERGIRGRMRWIARASLIPWTRIVRRASRMAKRNDKTFQRFRSIRLWSSGVLAQARYHRNKGTLARWAVGRLRRFLGSAGVGRSPIYLFPPECLREKPAVPVGPAARISVSVGNLSDLIDISLQHPELLVASQLAEYRRRLKKGDHAYLVREGEEVVLFAWATVKHGGILGSDTSQRISVDTPLMLLEECWPVSKVPDRIHYQELLYALGQEAKKKEAALGTCCLDQCPALRSETKSVEPVMV